MSAHVSIVTLLSLDDDQIDTVTDAVREWCAANRQDVNSQAGRIAMQTAVSLALASRRDPGDFADQLRRHLDTGLEQV